MGRRSFACILCCGMHRVEDEQHVFAVAQEDKPGTDLPIHFKAGDCPMEMPGSCKILCIQNSFENRPPPSSGNGQLL